MTCGKIFISFIALKKNIVGQFRHCILYKLFIIVTCHTNIKIIVPWYKTLVSYCSEQSSSIQKITDVVFFAEMINDLQHSQHYHLTLSQAWLKIFSCIRK